MRARSADAGDPRRREEATVRPAPTERTPYPKRQRGLPPFVDHETESLVAAERVSNTPSRQSSTKRSTRGTSGARPSRNRRARRMADDVAGQFAAATNPRRAERLAGRLAEAAEDFANDHFDDAARILAGIAREAPQVPEVRELLGLVRYRQGRWRPAIRELEAFRQLSNSVEQNAVLADCYRAVGNHTLVDELWQELRDASPDAALVTEGRIVAAGDLADQERLGEAISLLARGWRWPKRPQDHHLRRAYALADLYERAGDLPAARSLFERVASIDPELGDAAVRANALT